jgi:hypothetical protein
MPANVWVASGSGHVDHTARLQSLDGSNFSPAKRRMSPSAKTSTTPDSQVGTPAKHRERWRKLAQEKRQTAIAIPTITHFLRIGSLFETKSVWIWLPSVLRPRRLWLPASSQELLGELLRADRQCISVYLRSFCCSKLSRAPRLLSHSQTDQRRW